MNRRPRLTHARTVLARVCRWFVASKVGSDQRRGATSGMGTKVSKVDPRRRRRRRDDE